MIMEIVFIVTIILAGCLAQVVIHKYKGGNGI